MIWLLMGICIYAILQFQILFFFVILNWKDHHRELKEFPSASVLITSRNESKNIDRLLTSLDALDVSGVEVDFWMADDRSEDDTREKLKSWCELQSSRNFVAISKSDEGKYNENGKANALAILSDKAKGDIFFLTDTDCKLSPQWIKSGLSSFPDDSAMHLGITEVESASIFGSLQAVDWLHTLGIVKVMNDLGVGLTGLGNNMMVRRSTMEETGGFKEISGSLTEDLELCRLFLKQGKKVSQQVSPGILAKTKAQEPLTEFLDQRKRWISGVMTLPIFLKLLLTLELLFFPSIIALLFIQPVFALGLWASKALMQFAFLKTFAQKSGQKTPAHYFFLFDFYQLFTGLISILYYFWPSKIVWKSREY